MADGEQRRARTVAAAAVEVAAGLIGWSTPELGLGVLVVLGLVAALVALDTPTAAMVLAPLAVLVVLTVSLLRGSRR